MSQKIINSNKIDGPASPLFKTVPFTSGYHLGDIKLTESISEGMLQAIDHLPLGLCVAWGIPFDVGDLVIINRQPVTIKINPIKARWLIFMHTSDIRPIEVNQDCFISPMCGEGRLNEHAADYVMVFEDGSEERVEIRQRHQVGAFHRRWGENCFQAVPNQKLRPLHASHEQTRPHWGETQTRVASVEPPFWINWLWAWENPDPSRAITAVRFEPVAGTLILSGLAAGNVSEHPLRWRSRHKAVISLPPEITFQPDLNEKGLLSQIQLDMGQVISALPRSVYPDEMWGKTYNNQLPKLSERELVIEYTSHPDANFHLWDGSLIQVSRVESGETGLPLQFVPPAQQKVTLLVIEHGNAKPIPVKLHMHGMSGEYLAPTDRHRILNSAWFEDYSVDFSHNNKHFTTYIPGVTVVNLPCCKIFIEISKGFEIRPVRKVLNIQADTQEIIIEIEKVLNWREKGWVTADTHVHFLSPVSALLEGAGEGVNIINLLASQWGELMTNVGDFDGKTTWTSQEAGGNGEYMVRVGTENRQHVLGHISLLGYQGRIISPMTTGGPDESAMGDPIEMLLTEWARQCHKQNGLVVLPHFPNPRAEHAASIIAGDIDAVEMTSWGDLYGGINPYSLSDWYRYLNCGYLVPAVGGTDKMSADTAVGTVRTYARILKDQVFTYEAWMEAIQRRETFVTYGPLLEFNVDGVPMGSRIQMSAKGGTVDVVWQAASVTIPMTRVDLVVNGEIRESMPVNDQQVSGSWSVHVDRSSWLALLVRGKYPDQPELVAAHSTPVMIDIEGSQILAAADAVTILEQIEGALAYLDTIGTRAEDRAYKRMRLVLESSHRSLHNRMHQQGYFHDHTAATDHPEHH